MKIHVSYFYITIFYQLRTLCFGQGGATLRKTLILLEASESDGAFILLTLFAGAPGTRF